MDLLIFLSLNHFPPPPPPPLSLEKPGSSLLQEGEDGGVDAILEVHLLAVGGAWGWSQGYARRQAAANVGQELKEGSL